MGHCSAHVQGEVCSGAVFLAESGLVQASWAEHQSPLGTSKWKNEVNIHQVLIVCQALLKGLHCAQSHDNLMRHLHDNTS